MSTLSGVSSKGEKGKSKFQSLDINSIYHKTNKGESSEQQQAKSTVPRKHGMQNLGRVPSTRRAPVNLPSLKSEHSGSDPTVSLVPTGGTGWGSKQSEAAPPPITTTTPATTSGQTPSTNALAVVGTAPVQQTNITPTPPQPPKPVVSAGGDKTWSSVMVGVDIGGSGPNIGGGSGPSFLAHQSPQFQAEFPSLPGEGGAPGPPARAGEGGYGPGPSLRPQTEGSWAHGGGYQAPPPPQENQPRPLSTQFPPPPVPTSNIIPQFKGVVPSFMLNRGSGSGGGGGGFPGIFPSNFQNSIRPPKLQNTSDNRFLLGGGPRLPPLSDPDDLMSRPIIREEDLNRMDEISRDSGWATQDDIDYNQKLSFSDDETNGNDDEKEFKGKMSNINQMKEEKKDNETEKENHRDKINISEKHSEKSSQQPWQGRSPPTIVTADLRNPLTRLPHSNATRDMDIEDVWKEKRRQQSEQVAAVAEKAKQRKEEEEKRFEETRFKFEIEKRKKEDIDAEVEEKKDPAETFRQMTQLESRNFSRGESQQSSYRYAALPPRFQKQHIRQQQQNSSESRWSSQHFGGNKPRPRDNDDGKEKDDDKDKRERNTPEPLDRRDKEREGEIEWEGRRGGSGSFWEVPNIEDNKTSGRRDNKKTSDNYKSHSSLFDDRDSEWRERSDVRDRPGRPDSRASRPSRDSRTSRDETRSLQESVSNDYSWADTEYEKEIQEDKVSRKESYKEERRETQTHTRREGRVPGPITREKMEAYEHKHSMQAEKKELMSTSVENRLEEDSWKKLDPCTTNVSWADSSEGHSSPPQQDQKLNSTSASQVQTSQMSQLSSNQPSLQKLSQASTKTSETTMPPTAIGVDESNKNEKKEDIGPEKKKEAGMTGTLGVSSPTLVTLKEKDRSNNSGGGGRGGRNNRGGGRQNSYPSNFNSMYFRGSSAWASNKDTSRRGPSKAGKGWNASESEGSGDEVSASTESGKEDKKIERKQTPRSPKTSERKRDKEDRNRDSKKIELGDKSGLGGNLIRSKPQQQPSLSQSQQSQGQPQQQVGSHQGVYQGQQLVQSQQQQSGYDSGGGGSRKEGFPPRGEPSRRGRGGFSRVPGGRGPVGAHYGPPGSKPAFPTSLATSNDQEANDSSSEEKKRALITGRKDQRKSDSDSSRSCKTKLGKIKRDQEDWETTSEGSDSEAKGKQLRQNKKSGQRMGVEKRNMFTTGQMNGRPRSEDGKDKTRLNKEDDDGNRFANHSDIFHSNNGFQEVRSKKTGKDTRPLGKDDMKRPRGKEKAKGLQGSNSKGPQGKSYPREWNNKPPRMQRMAYIQQQQNQQQDTTVSDMNKLNQNLSMFPMRGDVSCPAPAPPPTVNAWEKPITAALRTTPPPTATNLHHLVPTIPNSQDKNVIELNDHGPSGTSSQTSSPSAEKALSKLGREAVEKSFLDGSTPPVQTIVFENTNLKTPSEIGLKSTKYPLKGPRIDKGRDRKLDEELDDGTPHMGLGGFKPGNDMKPGENKSQEPIQMPMSFSKSEDNADMKLDFPFDSDLSHLTDDKSNIPRSIHQVLGQNSAADLNQKIASVKKVWETPGSMMEHQHHDEVVSTSSSFTPNFGPAVDTSLDHSSAHQVDDNTFTSDVYTSQNPTSNRANYFIITSPQIQGSAAGYTSAGANIIKQDPANPTSNVCKVKPQPQQTVISSAIGTHSGPSLSSPPPPFTQQGHFSYQGQYNTMPAIPSPPAVLINSGAAASAQQVPPSHQAELFHSFPISGPTVIGSQQGRSGFSQYPYNLGGGLGSTSAFSQQNLYHLQQPPAPPNPPDVFPSLGQYRIQPSAAYGQSQQLSNSPSTVLITSSSNSLMSASVKSSPQPPPLGAIGSKAGYQSTAHPSQVQLNFIQYDTSQMLPQNFLQNSQLVQRHGGNNVVPTIQPPTSYYSGSAGGQTGLFQPGSSILAGGSQPAALHSATAFGMQGFGAQSATAPAQPASSNPVGVQSYSSQIGHFRGQAPATAYLKAGTNPVTGQHTSDPSKSPSTNQDVINSVFSSGGGGQIPSPKSRSAANSGSGGKQPQPPQQPSPTQAPPHHKFASYQQQSNMVMQGGNHNQQSGAGGNRGPPMPQGVRTGANNGNGLSNNGVSRYPTPIQRPQVVGVGYQAIQQQRHRVPQPPRPQHQQHMKISNTYYQPQGNNVKLDVEGKDGDKLQEATNPTNKAEKKEEQTNSSDQ